MAGHHAFLRHPKELLTRANEILTDPINGEMALDRVVDQSRLGLTRRKSSLLSLADRARDAGQWELAARLYRQSLDRDPQDPPIWVQYGHALKEWGQLRDPDKLAQAELAYRKALSLDWGVADSYLQLGHVLKLEGRKDEAITAYLRAFALDPLVAQAIDELGDLGWSEIELAELRRQAGPDRDPAAEDGHDRRAGDACGTGEWADESALQLVVDRPRIDGHRVSEPVRGRLQIEGWALARDGVAAIDISIDGEHVGAAQYGLGREDVARLWPDWPNSQLSGYALELRTPLRTGPHSGRVELRTDTGHSTAVDFEFDVDEIPDGYAPGMLRRKMPRSEIDLTANVLSGLGWQPLFGILLGVADPEDTVALDETLQSLRDQAYAQWHALVACGNAAVGLRLLARLAGEFPELSHHLSVLAEDEAGSFTEAIARSGGGNPPELVGILSVGDTLGCDALLRMAVAAGLEREAEFFYADERRISPITGKIEAFFKPQWSPDLLLATNYIGRFWCARAGLLDRVHARLQDWPRFGEYDLLLRCTEEARSIRHVPSVLCERRLHQIDDPARERQSLTRAMARRGIDGELEDGCAPGYYRVRRRPRFSGLVSIIIPTSGNVALLSKCLSGIFERTDYQNFEVVLVYNNSNPEAFPYLETIRHDRRVSIIDAQGPFNFSRICNLGAAAARGELLLFLNDDIEVIEPDWLGALIQHAERPEVGVVGARLLYPDGTVQHAGMFWAAGASGGRHAFRHAAGSDPGYFGLAVTPRNVMCVTGACLMMRRGWFEAVGRFDESHTIVNNDVDICLRSWSNGGLVVYEPAALLIHHERATRDNLPDEYNVETFWAKWGPLLNAGDPYYHPNLARDRDDYSADDEPVQLVYAGHPLFCREEIRRILVVKLDHLGDFITGVPALKRLQSHFPEAEIYLLASPGGAALTGFVPEIKEAISFEFFHPRSGLGERELSRDDLDALQRRLKPYRIDLAIDLRKHLDTRSVLRCTGARWLAGYDRDSRFPWLDIAVEWEDDEKLVAKRSHVGDALSRLVDAVALATTRDRTILRRSLEQGIDSTSPVARSSRPLVCIHAGVGAETRQWPAEYYAALIDLLVANHEADIVLVGGTDDAEIAEEVLARAEHKELVRSAVGTTGLADLPALLASATLFVGNNSGPQHIAAGLGVPTIGVYSGVVDAREWGPLGPNAVAVQRRMRCSPCYLVTAEQCPRALACLTELRPSAVYEVCRQMLCIKVPALALSQEMMSDRKIRSGVT
jgi:ADP-heptose:LPS heptosyltransferase/GT2 family glycosyltransferase